MKDPDTNRRKIKKEVHEFITNNDDNKDLKHILNLPLMPLINTLMTFIVNSNISIKERAINVMSKAVSLLADQNIEQAKTVMRRLVWSLNEESGNIGWGSAETIGEILARHEGLANEYHDILLPFINPEMSYLEHEPLLKEVLLGIERLGKARPHLIKNAKPLLKRFLDTKDPEMVKITKRIYDILTKI